MRMPEKTISPSPQWLRHITGETGWRLAIGLSSGTSADGVDAALVEIRGGGPRVSLRLKKWESYPYPTDLRKALLKLGSGGSTRVGTLARMDIVVGEWFARAAEMLLGSAGCSPNEVDFIGSHGQTICHLPRRRRIFGVETAATWQLGSLSRIAERTGITTVGNFRVRDVAAGGEGAPLLPYVDWVLFRSPMEGRLLLNIGGIANVTCLPRGTDPGGVLAFDVGPGNMVIDALVTRFTEGKQTLDTGGLMASMGSVDRRLLEDCLQHPFFRRRPPRSTGREEFGKSFVDRLWSDGEKRGLTVNDLVATATALTAHGVRGALESWGPHADGDWSETVAEFPQLFVSGGGGENPVLLGMLREVLQPLRVRSFDALGVPGRAREAVSFAVLGNDCLGRRACSLPRVTGARHPVVLGEVAWGSADPI